MKLREIIDHLGLEVATPGLDMDREVTGGYVSDLLSDVIGNSREGYVWITLQIHLNIVAVASLKGLSAIILVNNRRPDANTIQKALDENVPLLTSSLPTYELVGRLYALGLRCR